MTLLLDLVAASRRVSDTSSRLEKTRQLAACLRALDPGEVPIAIAYLSGETCQGKLGVSYGSLHAARAGNAAPQPSLTLKDVDDACSVIAQIKGKGAAGTRSERLRALFMQATAEEQDFLVRLIVGELRQGALRGLMLEAIAAATDLPVAAVRRAAMSAGGLSEVAAAALAEGLDGLSRFAIRLMQPLLPMLSQSAETPEAALSQLGRAAFEWKLDGARVQVHKARDEVRVYTRNLNDVTERVPEIVELVRGSPRMNLILDGEAIALRPDGSPLSFQLTMRRFGRKLDVEAMRRELPLSVFFFDCLLRDDQPLVDQPAQARFDALAGAVPPAAMGLTDEMLRWQTAEFMKREVSRDAYVVYLRPEIVVEIAFNEIQESSQYAGGLALRFARVKGYRLDKRVEEADTIEEVRKLYSAQVHSGGPL